MSVIAWDGKTLCADKLATSSGYCFSVTKIFRVPQGLVGIDGNMDSGLELIEWLNGGQSQDKYPEVQKDNERYCHMTLITPQGDILKYDRRPYPIRVEEKFTASGCGRDYALAAMYVGKTSREAVEIASHFDNSCGNGVDELSF